MRFAHRLAAVGRIAVFLVAASSAASASRAHAADPPKLSEKLSALAPFVGKTWKGNFKSSTPEKPMFDASRWEVALKGKAIRITHSVNDGVYGGETLVMWNPATKQIEAHYFTNAGFFTRSTMEVKDGKIHTREKVTGNANGITEVEAVTELLPSGELHVKSRYYNGKEWADGHEILYKPAPDAKVSAD
ncbi:MAG TPA: hypothetical protein PLV92_16445 [Pirellulaceae bacterium]|nr:hypothetical protein [Pirellulaceae bacterium]